MNVIIKSSKWRESDIPMIFGDNDDNVPKEEYPEVVDAKDIPDLMVKLGIYQSRSESVRAGREVKIPEGYTGMYKASKKHYLFIWNPTS